MLIISISAGFAFGVVLAALIAVAVMRYISHSADEVERVKYQRCNGPNADENVILIQEIWTECQNFNLKFAFFFQPNKRLNILILNFGATTLVKVNDTRYRENRFYNRVITWYTPFPTCLYQLLFSTYDYYSCFINTKLYIIDFRTSAIIVNVVTQPLPAKYITLNSPPPVEYLSAIE